MRLSKKVAMILLAIALGCVTLAACGQSFVVTTPHGKATCHVNGSANGGHCVIAGQTYSVGQTSAPATHRTPVPVASTPSATPTTDSPSPVATPQSTFDANAVQASENCLETFGTSDHDTLVSFSTSADARANMADCLQMPPQTVAQFLKLLFRYAYAAYVRGDFNSTQGQQGFIDTVQGDTLPAAVIQCDKHYVPN